MTRSRPYQNAFSSGELDPLLHARTDFQRYQTGLAKCQGFLPLRQGGFTRAPGTIFRGTTRNDLPARRVPFEFADNDALTLEFTDLTMRVWRYGALVESGGSPYELVTPYTESDLPNLQWVQDKDVIYLVDGRQPMQKLSRFALDNWSIDNAPLETGPFRVQNLDESVTMRASGATGNITITATGDPFSADWVGSLILLKPTDFTGVPLWVGNATASVGQRVYYEENIYRLDAGSNTGTNAPRHTEGTRRTDANSSTRWEFESDMSGIVEVTGFNSPNSVDARVIRRVPRPCIDDPTYRWSEGAWSSRRGYPSCIAMGDGQRLWAARTTSEPRTVWASTAGGFLDFTPGDEGDSSFAYAIAAAQTQNAIGWLIRGRDGMFIGALGEVVRGYSIASEQAIGPATFDTETVSTDGASSALPVSGYGYPIYISRGGLKFLELRYSFEADGAEPVELSLPSQHLGARGLKQCVWQGAPQRLTWFRVSDGALVVMGYDPKQDVIGWAVVPVAGGEVEEMDITPGLDGSADVLTLIVKRTINGQVKRFTEEQAMMFGLLTGSDPIHTAVHFFASSIFEADPASNTFDVPHLANEQVYVWTDAGEYGPLIVAGDGVVTLPAAVSHAVIGLFDETHFAETLDIQAEAPDGSSRGRPRKLAGSMGIDLHRTASGQIEAVERHFGQPDKLSGRQDLVPLGIAADLSTAYSGTSRTHPVSGHADGVRLRFYPAGGAPLTVTGITPNIDEAGA
ncbi:MAG: hypothetical protein AB3N12_01460 [Ruegeria sp.]